jgi:hypothetical protein
MRPPACTFRVSRACSSSYQMLLPPQFATMLMSSWRVTSGIGGTACTTARYGAVHRRTGNRRRGRGMSHGPRRYRLHLPWPRKQKMAHIGGVLDASERGKNSWHCGNAMRGAPICRLGAQE